MDHLNIELENCYGIKTLTHNFDFSHDSVYALYAPNGAMKSSLVLMFQDIADDVPSKDRIFSERVTKRDVNDENGIPIPKESVFVVQPYDETYVHSERTSVLLVDAKLRKEYEQLNIGIERAKDALLKALKNQSGSKRDFEKEISLAFTTSSEEFQTALTRVEKELEELTDTPLADVPYDQIFDEKILTVLKTKDVKTAIEDYVKRYNELLAASTYFKKGTFDYYNAEQIAKSLADNGFFDANHSINLNAANNLEIKTRKELEEVITKEKEVILKDRELRKKFNEIAKLLQKNVTLRGFQSYMLENEALLAQLSNIDKFKEDILKSYLKVNFPLYTELMNENKAAEDRRKEIEEEAARQQTQWERVIKIFNDRFVVPFVLVTENQIAVMLGHDQNITLGFIYKDGGDEKSLDRPSLLEVLSTGEKKALYVLNIIFEIETRRKTNQETLIIVDDIADSFDYQNKYAIIQYLRETSQDELFKQIIMTHNFDFFRTVESRFVKYKRCLMATKSSTGITLEKAKGIKNPFIKDWKAEFFTDPKKKIASIPFIRNLVEYTKGEDDPTFLKLTSLLHWKADSPAITVAELEKIYNDVFETRGASDDAARLVVELIHEQARLCIMAADGANFENKIVIAIAIRLSSEKFMVDKISDPDFVNEIGSNQNQELLIRFKHDFHRDVNSIATLERVMIMTPENIHLNSFMYEPIVDMSDIYLRKLYNDCLDLK